jgi:hypothetical protein
MMKNWIQIEEEQKEICRRLKVDWIPVERTQLIAVNESLFSNTQPLNGLRHPKQGSVEGWYLWSGNEIPQNDDNYFKPIHPEHLTTKRHIVLKYLGLPTGWRFQIDEGGYEDVWFDESLVKE